MMTDYAIPYYKWQSKLETNKKWEANEVEAMFIELMEQCRARSDGDETIEKLRAEIAKLNKELDEATDAIAVAHDFYY